MHLANGHKADAMLQGQFANMLSYSWLVGAQQGGVTHPPHAIEVLLKRLDA